MPLTTAPFHLAKRQESKIIHVNAKFRFGHESSVLHGDAEYLAHSFPRYPKTQQHQK